MDSTSLFILPENFVGPLKIEEFGVNEYAEQFTSSHIHARPDIFKKTALYVKQHPASGKLYFGKTLSENVKQYKGSGRLWGKVISGCKQIDTLFVRWFENPADLVQYALAFSVINDIVCSSKWCNLIPEDGLNGGAIGCSNYRHNTSGEIRLFPKGQQPSTDWESWAPMKNSKWWYHAESGKCIRAYACPGDDWTNENANMTGTRMYIDDDEVIHQVLPEIAKEYGWVEFSHSQGKRLYSDGNEVHLFEHDKQPEGWQIYDEKFGKRMYVLLDGSRKWFAPDEIPEGAVEFCSSKGCRKYINRETDHVIQVPHGAQPEGYEEYSFEREFPRFINCELEIRRFRVGTQPDGWYTLPKFQKYKSKVKVLCVNDSGDRKYFREHNEGWYPFSDTRNCITECPIDWIRSKYE